MKQGKHVILCVDDDLDIREQLQVVLEANGYIPLLAESAAAGLRVFHEHAPDLVLVDLMMEELDAGANLVKAVRALGSKAPIFMLSSAGDQLAAQTDVGALGVAGVFQKPVDPSTLLSALRTALG